MVATESPLTHSLTREDFLQACKGIHDEVMSKVNARFKNLPAPPALPQAELDRLVGEAVARQLPAVVEKVMESVIALLTSLPVVNVNRRPVEKTFTYDGMGRPATVVERELPDPMESGGPERR